MLGGENIGAATGLREVDTEFWALILQDEAWLAAEFAAIVSEPGEKKIRSSPPPGGTDAPSIDGPETRVTALVSGARWRPVGPPGRQWRRERAPPRGHEHQSDDEGW
jgi:hypothetical protein